MSHPDLNQLWNSLLPSAERTLAEYGEVHPFGGTMKRDGEIVAVRVEDDESPPSESVVDLMTQAFRQQARSGQLRAAGIWYDGRTTPPGQTVKCDAVCASMEHESGEALNFILPYEKTSAGDVQYGEMFTTPRTDSVFCAKRNRWWMALIALFRADLRVPCKQPLLHFRAQHSETHQPLHSDSYAPCVYHLPCCFYPDSNLQLSCGREALAC